MRRLVKRASALLIVVALVVGCSSEDESASPQGVQDLTGTTADEDTPSNDTAQPHDTDDDATGGDSQTEDEQDDQDPDDTNGDDQDSGQDSDNDSADFTADDVDELVNPLFAAQSEVLREILADEPAEGLDENHSARLGSVLSGPELAAVALEYHGYASSEAARAGLLDPDDLGDISWATQRVIRAEADACVVAIGEYDLQEIATEADPDLVVLLSLAINDNDDDNPWRVHDLNVLTSEGEPVPEEDWDDINYNEVLQTTCS